MAPTSLRWSQKNLSSLRKTTLARKGQVWVQDVHMPIESEGMNLHKDGSPSALRRPSRCGRPAGCRASQAGSLPRAHARRPANTAGAGVRDRRSLEHRGSALRPRPGPLAGPTRASCRQGRRSVRMGATMGLVSGGAARGGKHCPGPPLARSSTAVLRWGPDSGGRRAQPIAPAALKQDRA